MRNLAITLRSMLLSAAILGISAHVWPSFSY